MTVVRVTRVTDFAALGERWRALESRADCSFFQSWTWTGCLAEERFPDPLLVEATDNGRTAALGLFNRAGRTLFLHESGSPRLDCPYIEQNGIVTEAGRTEELTRACLAAVAGRYRVVISGTGDATRAAARATADLVWCRRSQAAPFVDLGALRRDGGDYLAGRSANTRQQIRRSDRFYERAGPIVIAGPASLDEALAMLDTMARLHQSRWTARGKPGSFAEPFFRRFHEALIRRAWPRQEVALRTISSGGTIIGILYNFSFRRRLLAYQSGFAYAAADRPAKPGLTCHAAAIRLALAEDYEIYDFLAGEDRYKRSLADGETRQSWVEAGPFWSPRLLVRCASGRLDLALVAARRSRDSLHIRFAGLLPGCQRIDDK